MATYRRVLGDPELLGDALERVPPGVPQVEEVSFVVREDAEIELWMYVDMTPSNHIVTERCPLMLCTSPHVL